MNGYPFLGSQGQPTHKAVDCTASNIIKVKVVGKMSVRQFDLSDRERSNDVWVINTAELFGLTEVKVDHYTFLGNCPPTPPLSQHFALSEK